jgi:hypothetical protein
MQPFPPGHTDDPADPFRGSVSIAWSREKTRLWAVRPRPLVKLYGKNPTDEQRATHGAKEKAWAKSYRVATKAHKAAST